MDSHFKALPIHRRVRRLMSYLLFEGRPLTTKGQFINPILKVFYSTCSAFSKSKLKRDPAFILGTGRSGTTILGVSLAAHESVGFLNEPKLPWYCSNSLDDVIGSYSDSDALYSMSESDFNQDSAQKITAIYKAYERISNCGLILDKYPEMIFRLAYVQQIFADGKFIFLFRNGKDIVSSISHWSERKGEKKAGETHDWWGRDDRKWTLLCNHVVAYDDDLKASIQNIKAYTDHKHRAAVEWIVTMKKGLQLKQQELSNFYPLRYEEYVTDEQVRSNLLDFLNLPTSDTYNDYCQKALREPVSHGEFFLPSEILDTFNRVQKELGYKDFANHEK
ncbi:sulfotransferase [Alteromonas sp. 5E99-2]|uniref:sulfotransferase family protein n=1 Tax=Alteromonas sp. 5E99-2 TaxID=2817683 RepID=UPI001A99F0DB|nr:sulfotransferase [Alteromonas sp. 5E99-2]MBO1254241.1 sulfotransferase [Alteromonas sp. 5E99-2]